MEIQQQRHGYAGGHKLLASSTKLDKVDQDLIDRLSDIAGAPNSDEPVPVYLTAYPLPSERFYVLAKTWYDVDAPRAGCVLTHSLLIPTKSWESAVNLISFAELHTAFTARDATPLSPLWAEPGNDYYPPAQGTGLADLTEALFLEDRQPILWFADSDPWTGLRILQALWPALRRQFALQTYSLKSRLIHSRPFDLMIAPKRARSRFSGWEGRRVEGDAPGRTPWTQRLVSAIFEDPIPSLKRIDPLSIIEQAGGDANALRLSLLWEQLSTDSSQNPKLKLALLDVLDAVAVSDQRRWQLARPIIHSAFADLKSSELDSEYLAVLLGKIEPRRVSEFEGEARSAIISQLTSDPASLGPLRVVGRKNQVVHDLVTDAVVDAIELLSGRTSQDLIERLDDSELAEGIHRVPTFAIRIASSEPQSAKVWKNAARAIKKLPPERLATVWEQLFDHISQPEQVPFLAALLRSADQDRLASATQKLARNRSIQEPLIAEELNKAWRRPENSIEQFREILLHEELGPNVTELLQHTFSGKQADFYWTIETKLPAHLRTELLNSLMGSSAGEGLIAKTLVDGSHVGAMLRSVDFGSLNADLIANVIGRTSKLTDTSFNEIVAWLRTDDGSYNQITHSLLRHELPLKNQKEKLRLGEILALRSIPQVLRNYS